MLDGIIPHDELLRRIDALRVERRLIGPVARSEPDCTPPVRYFYQPVERAADLALDFTYCVQGPKSVLLPPGETLLRFDHESGKFRVAPVIDQTPTALIGVHPCDVHAIELLDAVFSNDNPDAHYLARRRNLFIVAIDCPQPCTEGVFCRDMETHEARGGFDVILYRLDADQRYGVVFGTEAGRDWLRPDAPAGGMRTANSEDERAFIRYRQNKEHAFERLLPTARGELPAMMARSYDSLLWEATAQRCYSCGSCNLTCPTCYCFDIRDENDLGGGGCRARDWDACMARDFALVAGGHNFRAKPGQRLRHRLYRKAAWIEAQTGLHGCVGCARCDRACTAKISIVEMLRQLAEEAQHAGART